MQKVTSQELEQVSGGFQNVTIKAIQVNAAAFSANVGGALEQANGISVTNAFLSGNS